MAQGEGALGCLHWSVIETATGDILGSGRNGLDADDIELTEHRTAENLVYFRKRICLTGPFHFSIDEHPGRTREEVQGFGLRAVKEDHNTFSWEWFTIDGPDGATKLQEDGKLRIQIEQAARGWEVLRTDFLTDVSLRITRFDGDPSKEPSWRVTIHRDSWIAWPPATA